MTNRYKPVLDEAGKEERFHNFTVIDTEDNSVVFNGTVKWDGCINYQTNPEAMAHGCDIGDLLHQSQALMEAYKLCCSAMQTRNVFITKA